MMDVVRHLSQAEERDARSIARGKYGATGAESTDRQRVLRGKALDHYEAIIDDEREKMGLTAGPVNTDCAEGLRRKSRGLCPWHDAPEFGCEPCADILNALYERANR